MVTTGDPPLKGTPPGSVRRFVSDRIFVGGVITTEEGDFVVHIQTMMSLTLW